MPDGTCNASRVNESNNRLNQRLGDAWEMLPDGAKEIFLVGMEAYVEGMISPGMDIYCCAPAGWRD